MFILLLRQKKSAVSVDVVLQPSRFNLNRGINRWHDFRLRRQYTRRLYANPLSSKLSGKRDASEHHPRKLLCDSMTSETTAD